MRLTKNEETKVFTENYFAPPLFQHKSARLILADKNHVLLSDSFKAQDEILTYFEGKPSQIVKYLENENPLLEYQVYEIIPKVKGNLTLTSLYTKRTKSLGLWQITSK